MHGNGMRKKLIGSMLLFMLLLAVGCQQTQLNSVDRMLKHPEFKAAAKAAPHFTKEVLNKLAEYEYELERK